MSSISVVLASASVFEKGGSVQSEHQLEQKLEASLPTSHVLAVDLC